MSEMPWIRFFPSDWLAGTRGMSASETGIYITLIATMYERGEPIIEDNARLARLCGATKSAFKKALDILVSERKISRTENGLWNERVAKECGFRAKKSEVGLKNAEARWNKKPNKNNGSNHAIAPPAHCNGNANQKPEPERKKETKVSQKKRATRLSENWVLPDDWEAVAISMGLPQNRVQPEADKMREWSMSSPKGSKLDWLASWRSWVRRVVEDNPAMQPTATNPDLVVLKQNDPDFRAVETLRGEPVLIGQNGTATFRKTEIEQARKALA